MLVYLVDFNPLECLLLVIHQENKAAVKAAQLSACGESVINFLSSTAV